MAEDKSEQIGECSNCGKGSAWNTPHITPSGKILCNTCSYESPVLVQGIEQWTCGKGHIRLNKTDKHFTKKNATLSIHGDYASAWWDNGGRTYLLDEQEKKLALDDPEALLDKIINMRAEGLVKCSGCGIVMSEKDVAGFPLFAGITCKACWEEHQEAIKEQRKKGHVCRMCGKEWLRCCC